LETTIIPTPYTHHQYQIDSVLLFDNISSSFRRSGQQELVETSSTKSMTTTRSAGLMMLSRSTGTIRPGQFALVPNNSATFSCRRLTRHTKPISSTSRDSVPLSLDTRRTRRIAPQGCLGWRGLATGQTGLRRKEDEAVHETLETKPFINGTSSAEADRRTKDAGAEVESKSTASTETATSTNSEAPPPDPNILVRPTIPSSQVPFLAPSPLNQSVPPYPPIAKSVIREAIADFLSAEASGHVLPVPQEVYDKKSWFGWRVFYWRTKQLFKFYWAGCKCLKANYSHMRTLQKGVRREGWELTRREKRFVSRTKADLWKIFPFVFFLMTLEEVLPLMVLYTPWLLPSTTILPSQFLRIKSAEEIKRREALLEVGKELRRTQSEQDLGSPTVRSRGGLPVLAGLSPELVKGLCKALDLGTVAPMFWLQRRLTKRIS
jgi:hypothetical protein